MNGDNIKLMVFLSARNLKLFDKMYGPSRLLIHGNSSEDLLIYAEFGFKFSEGYRKSNVFYRIHWLKCVFSLVI